LAKMEGESYYGLGDYSRRIVVYVIIMTSGILLYICSVVKCVVLS